MSYLKIQFDKFRGSQPLIMDTLLETIDSLRLMQKNHEENPHLYGFNYKQDLINIADNRKRVFELKRFENSDDETEDDEKDALNDPEKHEDKKDTRTDTSMSFMDGTFWQ